MEFVCSHSNTMILLVPYSANITPKQVRKKIYKIHRTASLYLENKHDLHISFADCKIDKITMKVTNTSYSCFHYSFFEFFESPEKEMKFEIFLTFKIDYIADPVVKSEVRNLFTVNFAMIIKVKRMIFCSHFVKA